MTLLASQTAAPAEAARRSVFVSFQHEANSEAALCQPEQCDDDVVSLSPDRENPEVVPAAPAFENAPSIPDFALFPPREMVEMFGATIRTVPASTDEKN